MSEEIRPRERRVIVKDKAKLITRAIDALVEEDLQVAIRCRKCQDAIVRERSADGVDLLCKCSRRVINRGV